MKLLLLGKNGQVGWELQRSLAPLGDVVALDREGAAPLSGDLAIPASLVQTVRQVRPDVIVNAAAYTAVDKAEQEQDLARSINASAPGALAREAAAIDAWLVHFSTDYVFDGSGSKPWKEDDPVGPLNTYGQTKLEGEELIRASGCRHLILRTSWVYAARGHNFPRRILELAKEREALTVIDDQYGAPTGADLLADVTAHAIRTAVNRPDVVGTYHCVATGETTWYDYARHVVEFARAAGQSIRVPADGIRPVVTAAFPTPARRPGNSRLETAKLRQKFEVALPHWAAGVDRMLSEILGS